VHALTVEDVHALAAVLTALVLPGFTPASQQPAAGQLLTGVFPGTVRPGYVYLPPGFDPARRYPVAYLLHGMPGDPSEYVDGTQFGEFAGAGIGDGTLRPFIAVIPAAGADARYDGEWAGPWETAIVSGVVPWVDAHLPTIAAASGRVLAGLSAGGYGAVNTALHRPDLFGVVESWSGYFTPLRDGPFTHASAATLAANDPTRLARTEAAALRRDRVRFFVSTGPNHSHWFRPASTVAFAAELRGLGLPVRFMQYGSAKGEWRAQLDAGLDWALGR
jgi:enterochelin esterase-like enzyme